MLPTCRCTCGAPLELRHALAREELFHSANWVKWRLRFRCPRCRRSILREFDARTEPIETELEELVTDSATAVQITGRFS